MYDIICINKQKRRVKFIYYYQRIKDLREDEEILQNDIAKKLKITQQQYSLYESGKREIPMHLAIELSKFYKVSLDYIAGLTNDKGGLHSKADNSININQSHSNKPTVKIKKG